MKKLFTLMAAAMLAAGVVAQNVTLDLSKATTELTFDSETGAWTETFNADKTVIESQSFVFKHNAYTAWSSWWGFTVSNSTNNEPRTDYYTYQYSNMAKGGILLNEDGTVKRDENGVIEVSADMPYLVAYYSSYEGDKSTVLVFADGLAHEVVGVYVNLNSYAYYDVINGDGYARALNQDNDKFTLTIHGVKDDKSEAEVEVTLASYNNGDLTINRGWKYVDLTSLGAVNEMYFTMDSSDSGTYGMNTPSYFCLDKLTINGQSSSIESVQQNGVNIAYDRAAQVVNFGEPTFAAIYNTNGQQVKAGEGSSISVSDLESGIYVVKAGSSAIKIAK
ncbi:MAG: DUF4465 domain-containing protein [Muribaculaceae bacterium]